LKSFFVPKYLFGDRYNKYFADLEAVESFRFDSSPGSESYHANRDVEDDMSEFEVLQDVIREFPVMPHMPTEMWHMAFDDRGSDYVNLFNRLEFYFSPDFKLLQRIYKYHNLWLVSRMEFGDFVNRHDFWAGYREDLCGFIDFWRAFRSFYNLRSWVGFPFWDSRRRSFLPYEKRK
jgi:hypothetical protein